jgi:transcriptional regulator with XRE-family HTH domain
VEILERIRSLMRERSWTEYRLAKEAGLPQSTISHLFRRNNAPSFPTIAAVCDAFGLTLAQFFAEAGRENEPPLLLEQEEVLRLWAALPAEKKQVVRALMELLKD